MCLRRLGRSCRFGVWRKIFWHPGIGSTDIIKKITDIIKKIVRLWILNLKFCQSQDGNTSEIQLD